ncbi:MAG: hypothetical protein ACOX7P_08405 [Oscillospiraceae bacterium]|jgi:hypothetical protein
MKNKKRIIGLSIIAVVVLALFLYLVFPRVSHTDPPADAASGEDEKPFEVTISPQEITREQSQAFEGDTLVEEEGSELRLSLGVSIVNATERDYEKVWFELELNPEAKSVVASQIITYSSKLSMDYFYVTTSEKAMGEDTQFADDGSLMVTGFTHNFHSLLHSYMSPEKVAEALQYITVTIYWEGGSQCEQIPLSVAVDDLLN